MTFDQAFERLIGHEGGYVNDVRDPGGETKYGVSKRQYPNVDIPSLTLDEAKAIYRRDYWAPAGCDVVPEGIRFDLFDTAVNSGVVAAIRMLQRASNETDDGKLGSRTLLAAQTMDPERLLARFNGHRLDYLNDQKTWPAFGKGWTQRIAQNLMEA